MDIDTIIQDLNRRFAVPLPEFYRRRIIFWYDEDREFEDALDGLELENAKLVRLTGNNTFAVKKLLAVDDTTSNFLVYSPLSFARDDDNWLLNAQLYSEEFRADLNSIWMSEMGLPPTPLLRGQVKAYRKFFNSKERRAKVAAMDVKISTASGMHLAVMATLCKLKKPNPADIIRTVLQSGLDAETNSVYKSFVTYNAANHFWAMTAKYTGYSEGEDARLSRLAVHILLTACTRTLAPEHLAGLDSYIALSYQANCYDLVYDWMHSSDCQQYYHVARRVEHEARLRQRFEKLAVETLRDTECFPCVNEVILGQLMKDIGNQIIQVDVIKATVEKRRALVWYDYFADYYEGLEQVANMQTFYLDHSSGFHTVEPAKVWKQYTSDYYRMDAYYRQFQLCFGRCLKASNPLLDDPFKQVAEQVEGLYSHWFLGGLGDNWSDACAEELAEYGYLLGVDQQEAFYRSTVANAGSRVFVIISDAFRYEVAATLTEQLRRETQCKVELKSMEAIFPTVTKFGMAALLPHKKLEVVEKSGGLAMLADGTPTDAQYREKVLQSADKASVVLKYDAIIGMKRADRAARVKGMNVVYIYHDKVDEASHTSDSAVFPACEDAIAEIKNLIRIIVNEFSGTNIYVTADHGFLYTYSPLAEDDKVDKTTLANMDVEVERRYLITKKGARPDYLLPVKFTENYDAFAPRENVRIKKKGGGLNFVHGGISLQEMVVPLIEYHYLRNDYRAYQRNREKYDTKPVALELISSSRKVHNMIFTLSFFQKDAVGDNRSAATYLAYFEDAMGNCISDTVKIIADRKNENRPEREFRCKFNLRQGQYSNRDSYYLVIADETGLQAPQKVEFQIDIACAFDDFDF